MKRLLHETLRLKKFPTGERNQNGRPMGEITRDPITPKCGPPLFCRNFCAENFVIFLCEIKLLFTYLRGRVNVKPEEMPIFTERNRFPQTRHLREVEVVTEWPTPTTAEEVSSFLGITGHYRQHIPAYPRIAFPLTRLTEMGRKFKWMQQCAHAFESLKSALTAAPVLAFPSFNPDAPPFIQDNHAPVTTQLGLWYHNGMLTVGKG